MVVLSVNYSGDYMVVLSVNCSGDYVMVLRSYSLLMLKVHIVGF